MDIYTSGYTAGGYILQTLIYGRCRLPEGQRWQKSAARSGLGRCRAKGRRRRRARVDLRGAPCKGRVSACRGARVDWRGAPCKGRVRACRGARVHRGELCKECTARAAWRARDGEAGLARGPRVRESGARRGRRRVRGRRHEHGQMSDPPTDPTAPLFPPPPLPSPQVSRRAPLPLYSAVWMYILQGTL